jgi:hypothetical protein
MHTIEGDPRLGLQPADAPLNLLVRLIALAIAGGVEHVRPETLLMPCLRRMDD